MSTVIGGRLSIPDSENEVGILYSRSAELAFDIREGTKFGSDQNLLACQNEIALV